MKAELTRRSFFLGAAAAGAVPLAARAMRVASGFDENLSVFISDIHVASGEIKTQWGGVQPTYQNARFEQVVEAILAMRPLPRRVVAFGDIALWDGWHQDYEASAPGFRRLTDAGIEVHFAMGNHDHREPFLRHYPRYGKSSPVPGRIVSVIDLGTCDLLLLDSLDERSREGEGNPVPGAIDEAQWDWLKAEAVKRPRPFLCGAHHSPREMTRVIDGKPQNVLSFLKEVPNFCGWIHGHDHTWSKDYFARSWESTDVFRMAVLPSTGWWGDIGYAVMRTGASQAELSLVETDFYFPKPTEAGAPRPARWDAILAENQGQRCVFTYRN